MKDVMHLVATVAAWLLIVSIFSGLGYAVGHRSGTQERTAVEQANAACAAVGGIWIYADGSPRICMRRDQLVDIRRDK